MIRNTISVGTVIVDENGRPTPQFLRMLTEAFDLSTAPEVFQPSIGGISATIDIATALTIEVTNGVITGQT